MTNSSLRDYATCTGVSRRRQAAASRTIGVALLYVSSVFPAFAETARRVDSSQTTSLQFAITSALTEASNRFRLPVHWLRTVMRAESDGNAKSVSSKGAIGLMQLMPATYAELHMRYGLGADPFDPHDNILAGAAYLRELLDQYGESGFLAAFNAGPRRYEDYLRGRALPAETADYVRRITSAISLGGSSAAPYLASSDNRTSPIFVAITESEGREYKRPKHNVDAALGVEESTRRFLIPAQPAVRLFATDLHATSDSNAASPTASSRASDLFAIRQSSGASQ